MPPRRYLGLCAIARDETPFLREWAAYHHYIGFESIVIYDHQSAVPVSETLEDMRATGIVETYSIEGEAMQLVAYNHFLRDHGPFLRWAAFLDLDEFVCLKRDKDIRVLLRDYEAYAGLGLNWDVFSSSGFLGRPDGLVTENYRQSLGYSETIKSIVNPALVIMPESTHHCIFHQGFTVNADEIPAREHLAPPAVDRACLNHYSYRSQQDYEVKVFRPDAVYQGWNPRSMDIFYDQAAKTWVERSDILPMAAEVRGMLERGEFRQRQPITYAQAAALAPEKALALFSTLLRQGRSELAETLFALCYAAFRANPAFLRLGASLSRRLGKEDRAARLEAEIAAVGQG